MRFPALAPTPFPCLSSVIGTVPHKDGAVLPRFHDPVARAPTGSASEVRKIEGFGTEDLVGIVGEADPRGLALGEGPPPGAVERYDIVQRGQQVLEAFGTVLLFEEGKLEAFDVSP